MEGEINPETGEVSKEIKHRREVERLARWDADLELKNRKTKGLPQVMTDEVIRPLFQNILERQKELQQSGVTNLELLTPADWETYRTTFHEYFEAKREKENL